MPALDQRLDQGPALWLDYSDYAARLLAGGRGPWLDVAACLAWQRKAQGLLKSDVLGLPLAAVAAAWLDAQPGLRAAMAEKRRALFPLKTLLADVGLRGHLAELASGLRACFPATPLALVSPTPGRWVAEAWRQAHASDIDVSEDDADSAAVYLADFLRSFGESGVDVLLLQSGSQGAAACQPLHNLAAHYRWQTGLQQAGSDAEGDGFDFLIGARATPGKRAGHVIPDDFWTGTPPPHCPPQGFLYAPIPPDAQPETVLQRLAELH